MTSPDVIRPYPQAVEKDKRSSISSAIYRASYPLTNEEIESWGVKTKSGFLTAERISSAVGNVRYVANEHETQFYMAVEATQEVLRGRNGIDIILASYSFPDGEDLAQRINDEFDLRATTLLNIHMACSGFTAGLAFLHKHLEQFEGAKVLFLTAEKYHPFLYDLRQPEGIVHDPSMAQTIFSDGATATVFRNGVDLKTESVVSTQFTPEDAGLIRMPIDYSLMRGNHIYFPIAQPDSGKFEQNGRGVLTLIKRHILELVEETIARAGWKVQDVDTVYPHQGSKVMIQVVTEGLEGTEVYEDYEEGNFSSGSIPKGLSKAEEKGELQKGQKLILLGIGAGMSAISVAAKLA